MVEVGKSYEHGKGFANLQVPFLLQDGESRLHEPTPDDLWESQEGGVPAVKLDDLRNVWKLFRDAEARQSGAIGHGIYESVCSPGADVESIWFRASMLAMLNQMQPELLAQWIHDGQPDDAVFQVAATIPMEKMRTGVVRQGPPFDVEEFVRRIGART